MNYKIIFAFIALMFAFACEKDSVVNSDMQSVEFRENTPSLPISYMGVTPYIIDDLYTEGENPGGGNRTCEDVALAFSTSFMYSSCKVNYAGDFNFSECSDGGWPAGLTVNVTEGIYVTWSYTAPAGYCLSEMAVIMKGGNDANVYYYDFTDDPKSEEYTDSGLASPYNSSVSSAGLSNLTFCFNLVECGMPPVECYKDETAWAANGNVPGSLRYTTRGNWATYVEYAVDKTVNFYAGQNMLSGTATFSAPDDDMVTITINLTNGFLFFHEDVDNPDDNLKVQDYANAPSGNPAPGQFAWKQTLDFGTTTATIKVPYNNFYGIHLDVAYPVPCD